MRRWHTLVAVSVAEPIYFSAGITEPSNAPGVQLVRRVIRQWGLTMQAFTASPESTCRCCLQAIMHPDAHEEGGLACNDKKLLAEMRECVI
jgi:hypothetical protein